MTKVIETNLSIKDGEIVDHQSRVVEVESWDSLIQEIKEGKSISRSSIIGNLHGKTLLDNSIIENLKYDENTISCDVYNRFGHKTRKLFYLA
ncbi:hypothetical protein [Paenibacillus dendritiformis]|uniref:hypothetical protein n=1 Tax=Paenibacillus dendritiformis TaxID=130049 RepID=UPI00387E205C